MTNIKASTVSTGTTKKPKVQIQDGNVTQVAKKADSIFQKTKIKAGEESGTNQNAKAKKQAKNVINADTGQWSTHGQTARSKEGKASNIFTGSIGPESVVGQTARGPKAVNKAKVSAENPMSKIYQDSRGKEKAKNKMDAEVSSGDLAQKTKGGKKGKNKTKVVGDNNYYRANAGKNGRNKVNFEGDGNIINLRGRKNKVKAKGDENTVDSKKGAVKGKIKGKGSTVTTRGGDNNITTKGKGKFIDKRKNDNDTITLKGRKAKRSEVKGYENVQNGRGETLVSNGKKGKKHRWVTQEKYDSQQEKQAQKKKSES